MNSASGKAVGAFLEIPSDDRWVMPIRRFAIACLRRLGCDYAGFAAPPLFPLTCQNKTREGRVCGKQCDAAGKHQKCCAPGGVLMIRHDGLVWCLGQLAAWNLDPKPKLEQIVPELARQVDGQVEQARLDVIIHEATSRCLIDVVVVSRYAGDASFRRAGARRDGHAARRAESMKRSKYPLDELVRFAVETGGCLANAAFACRDCLNSRF